MLNLDFDNLGKVTLNRSTPIGPKPPANLHQQIVSQILNAKVTNHRSGITLKGDGWEMNFEDQLDGKCVHESGLEIVYDEHEVINIA